MADALAVAEAGKVRQHETDRVAQAAIGVDIGLDDVLADAQIFGEVGASRRISAPFLSAMTCGASVLPSDFDILRPWSSMTKPWVSTALYGARPRVPQLSKSEDWNQPRCWSEPSR
jgi:hypothetical protein